jgi:hypothetical protein
MAMQLGLKKKARFGWKGMFAQPHRWQIDQSSIDGSHMLERSLV